MPRRADAPAVQKAKGNPGRRKSAVAKREEEIARVAQILADAADPSDPLAPPKLIDRGPMFAGAIAVWKQLAPRLASTLRLQPHHRPVFAMFCVYFAEWVSANEDIITNGATQQVPTIAAGGTMERIRPIVKIRDAAFDQVLKLSQRFGLTPTDEYSLFKEQQLAAALNPTLFDQLPPRSPDATSDETEAPAPAGNVVGVMKTLDSPPPKHLQN
jgi:phage terminase small subunit